MREIIMDGQNMSSVDDVYDAFFQAVGAPEWHGRNFNALRDSIAAGRINKIEVPYLIKIKNYASIGPGAKRMADDFIALIVELQVAGCAIDIQTED